MTKRNRKAERGIALLMAIFALVLLSAIGLAMMYSANTETKVNSNFRDKQIAAYAAQSGAMEARARLHPLNGDIPAPAGVPVLGVKNVLYIINPGIGESASDIKPWQWDSKYPDTELCQENVLGIPLGTPGVPCSGSNSLPSSGGWHNKVNAQDLSGLGASPLNFKWVRITLKTTTMGPVPVSGAANAQLCYDGFNQYELPAGASSNCSPTGMVTAINVTNVGSGYTAAPLVTFINAAGDTGSGATAVAELTTTTTGQVTGITINNQGSGYTKNPTVVLTGGDGTGATASATIYPPGGPVDTLTSNVSSATACYLTPPAVTFSGGGSPDATATAHAVLGSDTCIYSWSATGSCGNSVNKGKTVSVGASGGSGFSGSITLDNSAGAPVLAGSMKVINPGSGYTTPVLTIASCPGITSSFVLGKKVTSLVLDTFGSGYSSAPTVTVAPPPIGGGPFTVATGTATVLPAGVNAGKIQSIIINNGGTGYTIAPTVTITPVDGNGTGAVATATLTAVSNISAVRVTNGGTGYKTAPTVAFTPVDGHGTGLAGSAIIGGGTYNGQVFMVTSMAQTPSGSRAITQMELASPPLVFLPTGALTLAGPNLPPCGGGLVPPDCTVAPLYSSAHSNNFQVNGVDAASCGGTAVAPKPSIGVFDDPSNPTTPTAIDAVTAALGKPENYPGKTTAPDIENIYGVLGDVMGTPGGLESLVSQIKATPGAVTYPSNPDNLNLGSKGLPVIDVVNGDVTLTGKTDGYGILVVTGKLTDSGNFSWHGLIYVIGQGEYDANGGGNGIIQGSVFVAKTRDASGNLLPKLGAPQMHWNGGGGNGIQYDHCWADDQLARIHFTPPGSNRPLRILSQRTVTY